MYSTLITKIKTTLAGVSNVKDYFSVPKSKLEKFPCVFFKPMGITNTFETSQENFKIYRFLMIVMAGGVKQTTPENLFDTVLPNTIDAIVAAFDENWNVGTIDGHRAWVKIDSADAWELSDEEDGLVAYAPLNLEIKLLSNN